MRKILIMLALLIGASVCYAQSKPIPRPGNGHNGGASGSHGGSKPKPKPKPDQNGSGQTLSFTVNGVTFEMVRVDGGSYQMGSNEWDWTQPMHTETVGTFYIGKTEVTQRLWAAVMGSSNLSGFRGENLPVEMVSWYDCQEFVDRLSRLTGRIFRLPTEAEWEYAARGGNRSRGYTYSGSDDIDSVAWYGENSGSTTHPVAQKLDNELGIYDMSGNVWEWCSDNYSSSYSSPRNSSYRVRRGGGWSGSAASCRVAYRSSYSPGYLISSLGLRLALDSTIEPEPVPAPAPAPIREPEPEPVPAPAPAPAPAPKPAPAKKAEPMGQNIFFLVDDSAIRQSEQVKIDKLVEYLKANPKAKLEITGYAAKEEGYPASNMALSQRRADAVSAAIEKAGISSSRITKNWRGDSQQPFRGIESYKNRVCICFVYDE